MNITSGSMCVKAVVRMTPPPKHERQDTIVAPRLPLSRLTFLATIIGIKPTMRDTKPSMDMVTILVVKRFIFLPVIRTVSIGYYLTSDEDSLYN